VEFINHIAAVMGILGR